VSHSARDSRDATRHPSGKRGAESDATRRGTNERTNERTNDERTTNEQRRKHPRRARERAGTVTRESDDATETDGRAEEDGGARGRGREINRRARHRASKELMMSTARTTTRTRELRERRDAVIERRRGTRRTFGDPPRERERRTRDEDDDDDGAPRRRREYLRGREGVTASLGAALSQRYDRVIEQRGRFERQTRKAPLPSMDDDDAGRTRRATRDWVVENARAAIEGGGSKHLVRRGDETPECVHRHEEYGKTPSYLIEMNRSREEREARERSAVAKNILKRQAAGRLADDRRRELISALRREHEKINASYQKLPFVVDTPNRKARKEEHERKLKCIEDDIETLSANTVYIDESPVVQ